jgi:heme/copper-type cytochrome/quinol oxidase subunit 3
MGVLFYVISGAHIAMTAAGLVFAGVMTIRTIGGEYSGRDREGLVAATLFWYVTVGLYGVVWYAIYVTK